MNINRKIRFGAFIVTYNRPKVLLKTVEAVFLQSLSPDFIWIIDNSDDFETRDSIISLFDIRVKYHHRGLRLASYKATYVYFVRSDHSLNQVMEYILFDL
jgi:hypothetical protein